METTNLLLRPWLDSDGDLLLSYILNPLVGPAAGWLPPGADEESKQILKNILTHPDTYIIALKAENYPLGCIALMPFGRSKLARDPREGELGFWLGQEFWGHGYMSEAPTAFLTYSFTVKKLSKVWFGYFAENTRSKKLSAKFGFQYAYTRPFAYWPALHTVKEEKITELTVEAWQKQQK